MLHVRVTKGVDKGEQIKTRQAVVSVGRSPRCDLELSDNKVSHVHGEFLTVGTRCFYRDLLSRNGSFVRSGGETFWLGPLQCERELTTDDEIILGDTVILVEAIVSDGARPARGGEDDFAATRAAEFNRREQSQGRPLDGADLAQFQGFLDLPSHDATSLKETKAAVCDALLKLFPEAACVTLIGLLPGDGKELTPARLDAAGAVSAGRKIEADRDEPRYSIHVLCQSHASRGLVYYGSEASLPDAPSVRLGTMDSCVCLPLWQGGELSGFLHAYTVAGHGRPFTRRDAQLFWLLGEVVSLLLGRAADAEQRSQWRAAAAAGEAVSGLSHDARPILDALGKNILGAERSFPALARNESWKFVRQDLKFLRRITRDAVRRARTSRGDIRPRKVRLRPLVDEALEMCNRYFIESAFRGGVNFVNACHRSHAAVIDRHAVQQALVNCLKNSVRPLRDAWRRRQDRSGNINIVSCDDFQSEQPYCLLSVCDDVGGISRQVLEQLGRPFVAGGDPRGLGLGLYIVSDVVGRMGGQVRIASSTETSGGFSPGTVVSLCLPKDHRSRILHNETFLPRLVVIWDYPLYRKRIEKHLAPGD